MRSASLEETRAGVRCVHQAFTIGRAHPWGIRRKHGAAAQYRAIAECAFKDLVSILTVMTDASNDGAGSIAALQKTFLALGNPAVVEKLRSLGITTTNGFEAFQQLGEKQLGIQAILDLGVASTRSAAGVAALTNNAEKLPKLHAGHSRLLRRGGAGDQGHL